jgi:DNA invertase Pin-like site-specific DNA recombinase
VSTPEQAREGFSVDTQIEKGCKYAELSDWTVAGEFRDEGESGSLSLEERPEGAQLLAALRRGEAEVAIFAKVDRFARTVRKALEDFETLEGLGVEVVFVDEKVDTTTPMGRAFRTLMLVFAELEGETIRERNMGGRYSKAQKGIWVGGGALPMGYAKDADGYFIEDPTTAGIVRYAYALAGKGDTLSTVTRRLNGEYPTFEGTRGAVGFAPGSVKRWLTLPGYKGEGFVQRVRSDSTTEADEFIAPAPALVTPEAWVDAVASLTRSRSAWRATHNRPEGEVSETVYSLSGRIYHEHVKSGPVTLSGVTPGSKDAKRRTRLYRCSHSTARYKERFKARDEFEPCEGWGVNPQNKKRRRISVRAAEIEARTILGLVEAFKSPEALRDLRDREDRRALAIEETEDTLDAAYRERDAIEEEEVDMAPTLRRLSSRAREAALDDFETRRAENAERIARLEADADDLADFGATVEAVVEVTVDYLGIAPSEAKVLFSAGTAKAEVIHLGSEWFRLMDRLRDEAAEVVAGDRSELSPEARAWLGEMVSRFGVSVTIEHGEGTKFAYHFKADRVLVFGRRSEAAPIFEAGGLIVKQMRRS